MLLSVVNIIYILLIRNYDISRVTSRNDVVPSLIFIFKYFSPAFFRSWKKQHSRCRNPVEIGHSFCKDRRIRASKICLSLDRRKFIL